MIAVELSGNKLNGWCWYPKGSMTLRNGNGPSHHSQKRYEQKEIYIWSSSTQLGNGPTVVSFLGILHISIPSTNNSKAFFLSVITSNGLSFFFKLFKTFNEVLSLKAHSIIVCYFYPMHLSFWSFAFRFSEFLFTALTHWTGQSPNVIWFLKGKRCSYVCMDCS